MKTDRKHLKRMTRRLPLILFTVVCSWFASSCDHISEEDRLIYVPMPTVNRSVLIEDFTGQRCVNCPNAADEIHSLQQEYGDSVVIAVGIHGGPMAVWPNPERGIVGLATETGDNYNTYWKVEQWPMGMVNRGGVTPYTNWKGLVREELQKTAPVSLNAVFEFTGSMQSKIQLTLEGTQGSTNAKIQLWVVEDDIKAIQLMPDGKANADYIHQHVFRAAVNGEWGEDFSIKEGEVKTFDYTQTFADDWAPEHLSIVAFAYNGQGVLQVIRCPLNTKTFNK